MSSVSYREIRVDHSELSELGRLWRDFCKRYEEEIAVGEEVFGEERPPSPCPRSLDDLHSHLLNILPQRIVSIEHDGPLDILAFSDYSIHDLNLLLDYVRKLDRKPGLIIYAGDDIHRFIPISAELIEKRVIWYFDEEYPMEVEEVLYGLEGSRFILRLPKQLDNPDVVRHRVLEMWSLVNTIHQLCEARRIGSVDDVKSLLRGLSTNFDVQLKGSMNTRIRIIDRSSGTGILELVLKPGQLVPRQGYWELYRRFDKDTIPRLSYKKVYEDEKYAYFYISSINTPSDNLFEVLASYAKYGLGAVRGNRDFRIDRARIRGRNVYELHTTLIKIGSFLVVGIEDMDEADIRLRLEFARRLLGKDEKLIIVSHVPPHGILDRALRHGDRNIGSIALREFLEEEERVCLVVCGHVHRCGGLSERLDNTLVVNVSSHDDIYSRANVAHITLVSDGTANIKIVKLPSPLEQKLLESNDVTSLIKMGFTRDEALSFIRAKERYGPRLFEYLESITQIKFKYGLPWKLALKLCEYGVRDEDDLNDEVFRRLDEYACSLSSGVYRVNLQRAYVKWLREREKKIYLLRSLPISDKIDRMIIFDTEYTPSESVLYGFLDLRTGEVRQFWFDERDKAIEFLNKRRSYVFVHWGGRDRYILINDLGQDVETFNLLYYVQTSLVAPINSTSLRDVHMALCGRIDDEWWREYFYNMDGFEKLALCNHILRDPGNYELRKKLSEANKADILALKHVVEKLIKLPCKQ